MTVLKSVVQVNNGNTGWTRADVITALETVFANLGWHGGTLQTGAIQTVIPPYTSTIPGPGWRASASNQITYTTIENKTWTVTNNGTTAYSFTQTAGSGSQSGDNFSITCKQGDVLTFNVNAAGHPFYIVFSNTGGYNANQVVSSTNIATNTPTYQVEGTGYTLYNTFTNYPTGQGTTTVTWDTNGVTQGTYYYVCANHPSMTGTITVQPNGRGGTVYDKSGNTSNQWYAERTHRCWFDYTVPVSGPRSAATFRVYRDNSGYVSGIDILNPTSTSGWSDNEVFTIPGTATGGTSPTHDVVFGTLATTGNSQTPSLRTTTMGSGSTFYQKNAANGWAVLKLINDESKTYGTSYYGFSLPVLPTSGSAYSNLIYLNSGSYWSFANRRENSYSNGTYQANSSSSTFNTTGQFVGVDGVDVASNAVTLSPVTSDPNSGSLIQYCSPSTPTSYPLAIRVFRAQSPQDTNFAIIQFTQTINNVVNVYGSFFLHKGTNYGNNVWDLNFVYQGGYTRISPDTNERIYFLTTGQTGWHGASTSVSETESNTSYVKTRESFYGYERERNGSTQPYDVRYTFFTNNINGDAGSQECVIYYRSAVDDNKDGDAARPGVYQLSSSANYYKPVKGLPISTMMVPVPYYLPDDYVMIQFAVTPAGSIFTSGDKIIITAGVEEYEVLTASYTQNTAGLSGSTVCRGIAFCARVV